MGRRHPAGGAWSLLGLAALVLAGCWASEIRRVTIDLDPLSAWAGQDDGLGAPDSLVAALVPITSRVPELSSGDVDGVEELALYVQIQNASFDPVDAVIVAHRSLVDRATVLDEGIALTRPITVQPQTAFQIDARNYHLFAEGFEEMRALILGGDFYVYVVSEATTFVVHGNVPTVSVLLTVKP